MPRIYRESLKLYNRIDARPVRQPFFDYASDDDLVGAYLGYDNVADLTRLRMLLLVLGFYDISRTQRLRHANRARFVALLHETLWFSGYKDKHQSFIGNLKELRDDGVTPEGCYSYAVNFDLFIGLVNGYLSLHQHRDALNVVFESDPAIRLYSELQALGLRFPTTYDCSRLKKPEISRSEADIEAYLQVTFLFESTKRILKPSVWLRQFPGCVAEGVPESAVESEA